ncbi:hypothetical protein NMY22_g12727 [Coprinellus aureogranulatus]|nr:hypothetical protein NMY22_g12727 [Coprinellus aureogranulatus]
MGHNPPCVASGGRSAKQKAGKAWAQMVPVRRQASDKSGTKEVAAQSDQLGHARHVEGSATQGKRRRLRRRDEIPRAPDLEEDVESAVEDGGVSDGDQQPRKRRRSDQCARNEDVDKEDNDDAEVTDGEDDGQEGSQEDDEDDEDDGPVNDEMLETERPTIISKKTVPRLSAHGRRSSIIEDSDDGGEEEDEGARPGKSAVDYDGNDGDVEMASQSRATSRAATLPPEGDSLFLPYDDGDDDILEPRQAPRKALRGIVFNSEVRSSHSYPLAQAVKEENVFQAHHLGVEGSRRRTPEFEAVEVEGDPNGKYPEHAILIPRLDGKNGILLRDQHPLIKRVVDRAISQVTKDMVVDCAWPEASARIQYGKAKLLSACAHVSRTYPQAADIEDRVKADLKFTKVLIEQIVDRLATHRHKVAKCAHAQVSFFKLGLGEECRERVGIVSSMHAYIFPGRWAGADHKAWDSNRREPFLNPAIIETLKSAYFGSEKAIGYRFRDDFKVLYNGETHYEISPSLLALAATAVYHSLQEYRTRAHMEIPFHGNVFFPTYKSHIRTLQKLEQERPSRYHEVLRRVYELVAIHGDHHEAPEEQDAFKLIDID